MSRTPVSGVPTVPSYLREPSGSTCWNCDRRADDLAIAVLRTSSGAARPFPLCRDCHGAIYPALVQVAAEAGIAIGHGAPCVGAYYTEATMGTAWS